MVDKNNDTTLVDWYADIITSKKDSLIDISDIIVADAWFSKKKFVDKLMGAGMNLISRFRDDADLLYLFRGKQSGGRGRPKKNMTGKLIITISEKITFSWFSKMKMQLSIVQKYILNH